MKDGEFLKEDMVDEYAQWCADLVRICEENDPGINILEPTNERDDIYCVQGDRLDELIEIYNACAQAVKAVNPALQVGGLAFARADLLDQVERFVDGAEVLDFVSIHFYASGDPDATDDDFYNRVYNPQNPTAGGMYTHAKVSLMPSIRQAA